MESAHAPAGERYLVSGPWERDDLVANLTNLLGQCDRAIQRVALAGEPEWVAS